MTACHEERQIFVRAGETMEVDDSSFFGTPEVMLRPRQRLGADGLEAYPTPVAGFSTNKKLRDNMSFSAFSPGSALRKPFNDVSATMRGTLLLVARCVHAAVPRVLRVPTASRKICSDSSQTSHTCMNGNDSPLSPGAPLCDMCHCSIPSFVAMPFSWIEGGLACCC